MDIRDGVGATPCPVTVVDSVGRLGKARAEIRRNVNFHSVLLGILPIIFWVTTGDKNTSIVQQDCLTMIESCDRSLAEDGEALMARLARVVKNGLQIGVNGQSESSDTLLSTTTGTGQ